MKNPHILLLDGKLWMVNLPEKPYQNRTEGIPTISKSWDDYDRAYSLALEQKIEVENSELVGKVMGSTLEFMLNADIRTSTGKIFLKENEPIKWEGGVDIIYQYKPDKSSTHWTDCHISVWQEYSNHEMKQFGLARKVVRLIAPVKEENSVVDNLSKLGWIEPSLDTVNEIPDGPGNNYTPFGEPVPSEQEKQEEMWQSVNPNKPKYCMLTNVHTEGMPVQWLDFWAEVENWYGDISKRETGEQFLKRMQTKFSITRK